MIKHHSTMRITLIAGVILLGLTVLALSVFFLINLSAARLQRQQDNFTRALREYDLYASFVPGLDRDFDKLEKDLDKLEKMTISAESWLSVLKRRRALSREYPASYENYKKSVDRALEIYPASSAIIALASEVLVKGTAITNEAEEKLRSWLPSLSGYEYNSLLLSLHVLLGDFRNTRRALELIPSYVFSDGTESVSINLILLKMLKGDIRNAFSDIQSMFYAFSPSREGLRFTAEFYYDYGDLEKSAEFFTQINDDGALSRASDALYLAGYTGSARNIWLLLVSANSTAQRRRDAELLYIEKSLYNLGITSENIDESISYFERLIDLDTDSISSFRQFGLIRYSRLLDLDDALEVLNKTRGLSPADFPYIDLELCKRLSAQWELRRQLAEAWLLIDRHPDNEDLYKWTSWLFLFQRNFGEMEILLSRIENLKFASLERNNWRPLLDRSIQLMVEGEIDKAHEILSGIPEEKADWAVYANLGRIQEALARYNSAVLQYEHSINRHPPVKTAARVQIRMSRCLNALNLVSEARQALERALELDPGNLTARLELDKIRQQAIGSRQ